MMLKKRMRYGFALVICSKSVLDCAGLGIGIVSQGQKFGCITFQNEVTGRRLDVLLYPLAGNFVPAEDDFCPRFCGECYLLGVVAVGAWSQLSGCFCRLRRDRPQGRI